MPKTLSPKSSVDIVSLSLVPYLHRQLFRINKQNIPIPDIVQSFEVDDSQKKYEFILGHLSFRSGRELKKKDVKYTIQSFIKGKALHWERLLNIKGAQEFSKGLKKSISGINIKEKGPKIIINLEEKDNDFLFKLAELRLSMIYDGIRPNDGLGNFKIEKSTNKEIILKNVHLGRFPEKIIYKKYHKRKAIEAFKNNEVDDLIMFSLTMKELDSLKPFSHMIEHHFPRTYSFFLNSRRLSFIQRKKLREKLSIKRMLKFCFKNKKKASYLIPPGFLGHIAKKYEASKNNFSCLKKREITVYIPKNLGGEKCINKFLSQIKLPCSKIKSYLVNFNKVIEGWKNNRIDAYVGYIEGGSSIDLFSHFSQNSTFLLGIKNDDIFSSLLSKFIAEKDIKMKSRYASLLNEHIQGLDTVLPMFYGAMPLIISKKYKKIEFGIRPPIGISLEEYLLKGGNK